MIEGIKVSDKWAPISGSPIVNVSRVRVLAEIPSQWVFSSWRFDKRSILPQNWAQIVEIW